MKKIILITLILALTSYAEILRDTLSDTTTIHYGKQVSIDNLSKIEFIIMVDDTATADLGSDSVDLDFGLQILSLAKNPLGIIDTLLGNRIIFGSLSTSDTTYGVLSEINASALDGLFLLSDVDTLGITGYAVRRAVLSSNTLCGQKVRPWIRGNGGAMKAGSYVKVEILIKASK